MIKFLCNLSELVFWVLVLGITTILGLILSPVAVIKGKDAFNNVMDIFFSIFIDPIEKLQRKIILKVWSNE